MKSQPDNVVIVRPGGEIGIKSRPVRALYEKMLLRAVRQSLKVDKIPYSEMWHTAGRIYVASANGERIAQVAAKVFGVSSTSSGIRVGSDLDEVVEAGTRFGKKVLMPGTFAVRCRRVGTHTYSSKQVEAVLGESLLGLGIGLKVDLTNPEQLLSVEIRDEMAILYSNSVRGPDGFPLGSQEPLVGIVDETSDSVIACWCMMKRGSSLKVVVLSGSEGISGSTLSNLKILAGWIPDRKLNVVAVPCPEDAQDARLLLHVRLAALVAAKERIGGVISGLHPEKLESYKIIEESPVWVFLPLAAMEDSLLRSWAKAIGVSLQPRKRYDDLDPKLRIFCANELNLIVKSEDIVITES